MKKQKDNIFVVLSRFPYPLEKGDKLRAFYQLKELSKHYSITLFAVSDKNIAPEHIQLLKEFVDEVHIGKNNWFSRILNMKLAFFSGKPFQVGYFYSYSNQRKINQLLKTKDYKHIYNQLIRTTEYTKNLHLIPKTLDYMDALSSGIERRIKDQPFYKKWVFKMEANRLRKYEQHIFDFFENRTMISLQDADLIFHPDRKKITPVPNGIDQTFFEDLDRPEKFDLVFVGNLSYPPNIKAVEFLANEILPNLQNCSLLISGATPSKQVKKLASQSSQITLTGWVDDIRESYLNAKIFVAPMFIGTGMQNKILEAMALGTPSITTTLANNAIDGEHQNSIIVADTSLAMIEEINSLLKDQAARKEIANNAKSFVKKHYQWESATNILVKLIESSKK